ncbi:MAG: hypothetical protein IKE29_20265 [Paenibacillus sp.]|uniref:hypothetical protein n=1 Tax=Paenibacillus sp. TaxID=58172 RepID=UPI0025D2F993|nr:hypothetical protein [Paenibacillus sp.]MBR2566929.1 hypothetical protein [Paenibacillus sp.]
MKYLYHYYESVRGPFQTLTDLPLHEAMIIQDQLKQDKSLFASKRSDEYLFIRRDLEKRAREIFIGKGGKPIRSNPHYMTLGKCQWLKEWYKDGKELEIDIDEFNEKTISFTYGDLFPTMRFQDGKPYRGQIYMKEEIYKLIKEYGLPQDWNRQGNKGPERYIEVQIWDDRPLVKHIRR